MRDGRSTSSRTAEATRATLGISEFIGGDQFDIGEAGDHHLRNPVATVNRKRFRVRIEHDHADFAAISGINRSGRIGET